MKQRRNRFQHSEASAEEVERRAHIRADREALYARRRSEIAASAEEPKQKAISAGVEIPPDWRSLHWKRRVSLAKSCYPGAQFINGADADEAVERYIGGDK